MTKRNQQENRGALAYSVFVLCLAVAVLWLGQHYNGVEAKVSSGDGQNTAPAAVFSADAATLGVIPDGPGTPTLCGADGAPRNVTFNVTGLSGPPSSVAVGMTFGAPVHTFVGDVTAVLIAPNGASHTLFGYTLSTTASGCGDSSDLAGPYNFLDAAAAPPSGGWWQSATAAGAAVALTAGDYRTTGKGGAGATNPMPATTMNTAFAGVANPNGTWTLRLTDGGGGDTGGITAATLTLTAAAAPTQNVVDFDGNGKTDFAVVRNTGGGSTGQITWFFALNGPGSTVASAWGIATDFFTPVDFDGDNKTDIAVWRSGAATVASFYILQSATNTVRIDAFGQTGDDPTVVGDYDGDGKADVAVYRGGATSGALSTWFYRGSLNNPSGNVTYVPWGQNGDFVAPGDYNGDGKNDFVVQRNNGGGQARFWMLMSNGTIDNSIVFGAATDVIVPGDYDGDGKTDIATIRGVSGQINWFVRPSSTGVISATPFAVFGASATDFPTQGDYDGDGKTDPAVWRPSATAGASSFWALGSTSGTIGVPFGANGDYPVANFDSH